jgi:NAD+ diphosphatase
MIRPGFTGSPIDRVDAIRNDEAAYGELRLDWRCRILALDGLDPVVEDGIRLKWHSAADHSEDVELILLGLLDDKPHFVPLVEATGGMSRTPAIWSAMSILPAEEAAIYGTARSLVDWHNTHKYCGRCGGSTKLFRAGWGRKCSACDAEHFPRTDPVVIMIAEFEEKALLGRQAAWPKGNYSALAGFLEPGESIEEAVRREIWEEAGVRCDDVRYIASQPWPFGGSQLMIGCVAQAQSNMLTIDTTELEDAIWVSREEVLVVLKDAPEKRFNAPPHFAIAHSLLRAWAAEN